MPLFRLVTDEDTDTMWAALMVAGEQITLTTGVASGLFGQQRIPIGNPLLPVHPFQLTLPVHHLLSGHGV